MADVTSRLRLVVDSTGVDKAGNKLKDLKRSAKEADNTARGLKNAFASLAITLGAAFSVRAVVQYADAWKRAENQIKTVAGTIEGVRAAQEGVFAVAQKTFSAYDATAALYTKLTRAGGDLISGQKEALRLVETVNKALAVGGASASERNSVILQLGQAVGSGRLQGDEFRSISENAPLILDALAKSTGRARGELKQLGTEGKITSEVLIKAIKEYGDTVDATFSKFSPTIADSFTKLQNAFQKFVGQNGAPLFSVIAAAISLLADNLDTVAKYATIAGTAFATAFITSNLTGWIASATSAVKALGLAIASNPIGLIATAIAAAAVAFYEFSDSMKAAEGQFTSTNEKLKGEVLSYSVTVQDVLKEIPGFIGDVFHGLSKSTGAYLKTAFGPDVLENISDFFKVILQMAKKAINIMIGLWVGLPAAISQTMQALPLLINEAFTKALNAAGRTVANFINKNRDLLNSMLQAVSLVTHIPIPQIPVVQWTDFVTPAMGAAKKVGDAWKGVFNTDYIGGAIDLAIRGMDQLTERAVNTAKANAEAQALAAKAAGATGTGTGANPMSVAEKASRDKAAEQTALTQTAAGIGVLKGELSELGKVVGKVLSDYLEMPIAIARQREGVKAIIRDMKTYNDEAEATLSGGGEAYDRFIAKKALEQQIGEKITGQSAEELKILEDQYILEQKRYELDLHRANLTSTAIGNRALGGTVDALDKFYDNFLIDGGKALSELGSDMVSVFRQSASDGLKAGFEPVTEWLAKKMEASAKGFAEALGSLGLDGKKGSGLFGSIQDLFKGSGSFSSIFDNLGKTIAAGGPMIVASLQSVISKAIGVKAENAWGKAGSNFGIIGTIIGNLIGGGKTDARAAANLTSKGTVSGTIFGDKRTDQTTSALNSVIGAIQSGYSAIESLGGKITTYVTGLYIGQRDRPNANLSNGTTASAAVGDAAGLANSALIGVLKATDLGSAALNKIRDGLIASGAGFDDIASTLSSVKSALDGVTPALSDWQTKLKSITDVFDPLIAQTGAYGAALKDAYNTAKGALTTSFNEDVAKQLSDIVTPLASQFADLLKTQATRTSDAKALGGNMTQVNALNNAELQKFLDGVVSSADNLGDLTTEMNKMIAAAKAAGKDVSALSAAFTKAKATITSTFNSQIQDSIKGFLNSPTDQLNDLLKEQAARLEEAKKVGGDIGAVERLTALQLQSFFKGLSEDALKEVSDFLGLFDQATNSVVKNLDLSRQDLQGRADSFAQFAETFSQLNADLTQKYIAASPRESLGLLRGNVNDLLAGVKGGNDKAAQDLPDAINKLVDAARATYGNTDGFNEILAFAQDTLAQAKTASLGVQSDAEKQIQALDANNDILSDIRDILQSSSASNAFFQSYLSGGVASSDALLALIQQGAGLTTTAANDNASALNITGLIAQSVQPIIAPLAASIDNFTQRLATMPSLQQLTIEAVDRGSDKIVSAIDRLDARLDRIETLTKKELTELEQIPKVA